MSKPTVAVILVNWNGWRECIECLDTLLCSEGANFDVYIVDNDSADDSLNEIERWCREPTADPSWQAFPGVRRLSAAAVPSPVGLRSVVWRGAALPPPPVGCQLTLIQSGANLGFAGGNNVGMRCAGLDRYDYFWLLNTDTVVPVDALSQLLTEAELVPAAGLLGSTLVYYDQPATVQAVGGAVNPRDLHTYHLGEGLALSNLPAPAAVAPDLAYVVGASMLASQAFVREVGLMAEDYFLYFEELDWATRGAGRFHLAWAPASVVYHKGGSTSAKVASRFSLQKFYINRLRFVARHHPRALLRVWLLMLLEGLRLLRRANWPHLAALLDAMRQSPAIAARERSRRAPI